MKIATLLRPGLDDVVARAREVEAMGLDGVFTFEGPHDVFLPLALAAETTELDLFTNVAIAFPRSPVHLAHQAYDLHALSAGRFMLGLGSQVRPHIEKRYSSEWARPVARMRELVLAVKSVLGCWQEATKLDFRGEFFRHTLMTPAFDPGPNPYGIPPVLLGALGPRMTAVAAEVADGLLVHPFTSERFVRERTMPVITDALHRAERAPDDFRIVVNVIVCTGRDEREMEVAEAGVRRLLAFYGSTPSYKPTLDVEGYGDLQPALNALSKQGRWEEMAGLVDDDLLERIAVWGEPKVVAHRIVDRYAGIADRIGFALPYSVGPDLLGEVADGFRAAAP